MRKAYNLLHDGILALNRAEQQGMRIDVEYCERKKTHLTRKIDRLEDNFKQTKFGKHWLHYYKIKTNLNSNYQLANLLYNVKKIKPMKLTNKEKGSTDDEALSQLNMPELMPLLEIRKLKKIRDTYLDAFLREQVNGYIHPFFNLHIPVTYRSSCDRPNLQNTPIRDEVAMNLCRKAILPRPGYQLLGLDYQGIEVRIAACYHKDPAMIKYIENPQSDMHGDMAKQIFFLDPFDKNIPTHKILRDATKNGFVFPQFYGDYYINCAKHLACTWGKLPEGRWKAGQGIDMPEGKLSDHLRANNINNFKMFVDHIEQIEKDFWDNRFPVYKRWKEKWWKQYQKKGYLDMLTGFQCKGIMRKNDAINYPIQGTAFHCLLWTFIEVDKISREEKWKTRLVGQIHDEMIFDTHPDELDHVLQTVKRIACQDIREEWPWIIVPLSVDAEICGIDRPWNEKKSININ